MPPPRERESQPSPTRLQQYQRARKKFACKVYTLVLLFICITLLQWTPLILITDTQDVLRDYFFIPIVGLFVSLLSVSVFIFCENIRFMLPCNWLMALLIVEGVTVGLARLVIEADLTKFGISFAVVALIMIIFVVIGIWMKHDLTLDVVVLFVLAVIFFIGGVFFVMLHILLATAYSLLIYAVFVGLTVISFVMYHAQTVNGSRYAEMRLNDYLLAALILYHDTIILFVLSLYLVGNVPSLSSVYYETQANQTNTTTAPPATTAAPPG